MEIALIVLVALSFAVRILPGILQFAWVVSLVVAIWWVIFSKGRGRVGKNRLFRNRR